MTFLNFHNFRKVFSAQIFQENTFLETKLNFPLTIKCFPLTNFSNGKQTQESLENEFREINIALIKFSIKSYLIKSSNFNL